MGLGSERKRTGLLLLLLDARISSRGGEKGLDLLQSGLSRTSKEDSAHRAEGGMEVKEQEVLVSGLVNCYPHVRELGDSVTNSSDICSDLLRRVVRDGMKLAASDHAVGHVRFLEVTFERCPSLCSRLLVDNEMVVVLMDLGVKVGQKHLVKGDLICVVLLRTFLRDEESASSHSEHAEATHKLSPGGSLEHSNSGEDMEEGRGDVGRHMGNVTCDVTVTRCEVYPEARRGIHSKMK
ncbi:hypothetical protein DFH06DRAFT_450968 [Mycena polygramma]|nr:hypothetical protein DFH06DRAFT_450968 [Mycena polygramma]